MLSEMIDVVTLSRKRCATPIRGDLKYTVKENFVGRPVTGYHPEAGEICLMAEEAGGPICEVQNSLIKNHGLGLLIFDSYRPLKAVRDFAKWIQSPPESAYELERKQIHYPRLEKRLLGEKGYIATLVSQHCYGSTVDLSLVSLETGLELDMGAIFDFLDPLSHATVGPAEIGEKAYHHRHILKEAMQAQGFQVHPQEFWHFDFPKHKEREPMDFDITPGLRGWRV